MYNRGFYGRGRICGRGLRPRPFKFSRVLNPRFCKRWDNTLSPHWADRVSEWRCLVENKRSWHFKLLLHTKKHKKSMAALCFGWEVLQVVPVDSQTSLVGVWRVCVCLCLFLCITVYNFSINSQTYANSHPNTVIQTHTQTYTITDNTDTDDGWDGVFG